VRAILLLVSLTLAGCRGCVPRGSAPSIPDEKLETEREPVYQDFDVYSGRLAVTRFRVVDVGDFEFSVPDGWFRADEDAEFAAVHFECPKAAARVGLLRHPLGQQWSHLVADLVDGGWDVKDASAEMERGVFTGRDNLTLEPVTRHVAVFELPSEQAIFFCQGPALPETDLICESFLRSIRVTR
jgi:hypothetical protein